jgi:hypothetical protein
MGREDGHAGGFRASLPESPPGFRGSHVKRGMQAANRNPSRSGTERRSNFRGTLVLIQEILPDGKRRSH